MKKVQFVLIMLALAAFAQAANQHTPEARIASDGAPLMRVTSGGQQVGITNLRSGKAASATEWDQAARGTVQLHSGRNMGQVYRFEHDGVMVNITRVSNGVVLHWQLVTPPYKSYNYSVATDGDFRSLSRIFATGDKVFMLVAQNPTYEKVTLVPIRPAEARR